ncbi:hypothetical protein HOE04_01615 [archaeon]|jgi:hypothetical protein|nr:hypothetical protein [archaeon]
METKYRIKENYFHLKKGKITEESDLKGILSANPRVKHYYHQLANIYDGSRCGIDDSQMEGCNKIFKVFLENLIQIGVIELNETRRRKR